MARSRRPRVIDNEAATFLGEVYQRADAFLFGRRTYEIFGGSWESVPGGQIRATTRSQWR
jgi:dihydrofolate reductase